MLANISIGQILNERRRLSHHAAVGRAAVRKLPGQQHRRLGDQLDSEVLGNVCPGVKKEQQNRHLSKRSE